MSRRSKGTAAAGAVRASQGLQRRGVEDTVARRRLCMMEDGAALNGGKSDIDVSIISEKSLLILKHDWQVVTLNPREVTWIL